MAMVRCVPGRGELDLTMYRVSLDLAANRAGPVVLDLRGLNNPLRAAAQARELWESAGVSL